MKPVSIVIVVVSVIALSAGLIWPHLAGSFLRILLALAGLSVVVRWSVHARLPRRVVSDVYSPFDSDATPPTPSATLAGIQSLTVLLAPSDSSVDALRAPIPEAARRTVTTHADHRLAERHGLRLESPSDHDRIRALVSDATWSLIRPRPARGPSSFLDDPVPQERLEAILDDLEQI